MTNRDLTRMVRNYLEKLEFNHPFVDSYRFYENSNRKWACKELLRYIRQSEQVPFILTPQEVLEQFADKMKNYACLNAKNSLAFTIAAETAEYFLEESWRF